MLRFINKLFVKAQRKIQGIPWGAAHLYNKVVTRYLESSYKHVVHEVSRVPSRRIVDIGCGPGGLLLKIAEREFREILLGIDISSAMTYIARRNALRRGLYSFVDFIVADAHLMPIRNGSIDLILSIGTLHHIKDPEELFKEVKRVLRKGGEAWIYEFSHDVPWKDVKKTAKFLKRPALLLKLSAALHGLPRRVFESGYIKESLKSSNVTYYIFYSGIVTKLVIEEG